MSEVNQDEAMATVQAELSRVQTLVDRYRAMMAASWYNASKRRYEIAEMEVALYSLGVERPLWAGRFGGESCER